MNAAIKALNNDTENAAPPVAPKPQASTQVVDVASQLERLATLMKKGILTKEEFAEQKAKILAAS